MSGGSPAGAHPVAARVLIENTAKRPAFHPEAAVSSALFETAEKFEVSFCRILVRPLARQARARSLFYCKAVCGPKLHPFVCLFLTSITSLASSLLNPLPVNLVVKRES